MYTKIIFLFSTIVIIFAYNKNDNNNNKEKNSLCPMEKPFLGEMTDKVISCFKTKDKIRRMNETSNKDLFPRVFKHSEKKNLKENKNMNMDMTNKKSSLCQKKKIKTYIYAGPLGYTSEVTAACSLSSNLISGGCFIWEPDVGQGISASYGDFIQDLWYCSMIPLNINDTKRQLVYAKSDCCEK